MDATGDDVGGDEGVDLAGARSPPARVRAGPATGCRGSPGPARPAGASFSADVVRAVLRLAEHDRRARELDDVGADLRTLVTLDRPPEVAGERRCRRVVGEHVADRVALVVADERVDDAVEGRGVQQRLTARAASGRAARGRRGGIPCRPCGRLRRRRRSRPRSEVDLTALDQVAEPAGAGDEHVDAAAQGPELRRRSRRRRTRRRRGACDRGPATRARSHDLVGELPRGDEHEAGRALRRGAADPDARAGCRRRGSCPSRSGARPLRSRPAMPSGRVSGLDGEGRVDAACGLERAHEVGGDAELGEADGVVGRARMGGFGG